MKVKKVLSAVIAGVMVITTQLSSVAFGETPDSTDEALAVSHASETALKVTSDDTEYTYCDSCNAWHDQNGEIVDKLSVVPDSYSTASETTVYATIYDSNDKLLWANIGTDDNFTQTEGAAYCKFFFWNGMTPARKSVRLNIEKKLMADGTVDIITEDNILTEEAFYITDGVEVTIPVGVKVNDGLTALSVLVEKKSATDSNLSAGENETLNTYDVHVEGIAEDNTVAVIVKMSEVLPENLNSSALKICHVENGETVAMTYVPSDEPLTGHNQFHYDPATGDLTVAMVSFSEIALLIDNTNPWDGTADEAWYDADKTEYVVRNAQQLAGFAQIVANGNDFTDKTVSLAADIILSGGTFYPIGYWTEQDGRAFGKFGGKFSGTFDGAGHTITGLRQNGWEMKGEYTDSGYFNDAMGLFGYVKDATVKNLTVDNFEMVMEFAPMGCVTAFADGNCTFENISVTRCHPQTYNTGIAGIVGWDYGESSNYTFKNITVDSSNTFSALWGTYDLPGGGIMGYLGKTGTAHFENCNVSCVLDVYNDVCGNYQYYWYRYCGMYIGTVDRATTNADGVQIPDLNGITATNCTVNIGDWSNYYYCEFESAGKPSYAQEGQYKFRRCTEEELVRDENCNVTGCTHTHSEVEDNRAVLLKFNQLFNGYGWGIKATDLVDYPAIQISDITEAKAKFNTKVTGTSDAPYEINSDASLTVGDLFQAIEGENINNAAVYVSITKVNDEDTVAGTFTANTDNWADGILSFTGNGLVKLTIQDYNYCSPTELYLNVTERQNVTKFAVKFENTDKYLYRVGNQNTVALGSLFEAVDGVTIGSKVAVTVEKIDTDTDVEGTYTANTTDWTKGTLQFTGTGPVKVTITDNDYCIETELLLEVVDGKNVTTAANATASNIVLLNDVSTAGLTISNGYTLFGNGFEVNDTRTAEKTTYNYGWIQIFGGYIDNAQLLGQDYPTAVTSGVENQYYSPSVRIQQGGGIYNSKVNGGRYAVFTSGGNIEIVNTTIVGGAVANMNVSSTGNLILDNVTTVQKSSLTNPPYGLGITVSSADVQITLKNALKQYNWGMSSDIPSSYSSIFSDLYTETDYSHIRYTDGENTYVNTGILFFEDSGDALDGSNLVNAGGTESFTLNEVTYTKITKTVFGNTGVCYTYDVNKSGNPDNMLNYPEYLSEGQYHTAPEFDYNISDDNTEKRHYAYYDTDTGILKVGFEEESTAGYEWTPTPSASKNGSDIAVTVTMNGVDYTGKSITFDQVGDYNIIYTYEDNGNYDKNGNPYPVTYEKNLPVKVVAIAEDAKNADFTFYAPDGTTYSAKVEVIDGKNYIMPDVTATETGKVMSTTVNGTTVYAPYVECQYNDNSSDFNYVYPLLTGVNITDYEGGKPSGNKTNYDKNTTDTALFGTPGTRFNVTTALETWNYGISSDKMDFKTKSEYGLCLWSGAKGSDITAMSIVGEFSYTDNAGTTYYYCIYYNMAAHTCPSCVTPDTLITLADGTQKEVQYLEVNDELLVWNMFTGTQDTAPILFNANDPAKEVDVIHLTFSDGTIVKVINEHGFFDVDERKYVYLDKEAGTYIGHRFDKSGNVVELVDVKIKKEVTEAWSPVTYGHLCYYVNGMLSMPGGIEGIFNYFEVDSDKMKYDEAAMQEDIEKYGLFTYEEFAKEVPVPEIMFDAFAGQYLKVSIGKGITTFDKLRGLAEEYLIFFE